MFTRDGVLRASPPTRRPTWSIPTGAGDTFAGGFVGYVAAHATRTSDELLRTAMAYGTAMASFNVEAFGSERCRR
jgi:fructose-1-phosphate kinase PfkB-like protein